MTRVVLTTTSPEQTAALGFDLASRLQPDDVVLLNGDLGTGKTTLVQSIGQALGVVCQMQSPTFTIMAEYPAQIGDVPIVLAHLALYRLESGIDLVAAGIEDLTDRANVVTLIEWPDRLAQLPDAPLWTISLEHQGGDSRRFTILEPDRG